ncbi:MAG: hypothetical protein WC364_08100, partial [Eubacteriales bacterium]
MILPTEKSAWGISLAGSKLKGKSWSAKETVKNHTGAFVDAVNAVCLSGNFYAPKINTDFPQAGIVPADDAFKGSREKSQNVLSDESIFKDSFQSMTGKVNISGEYPAVYQSREDLTGIDKKDDLQVDCLDEEHNAVQAKGSQKYAVDQINAGGSVLFSSVTPNSGEESNQDLVKESGLPQVIQPSTPERPRVDYQAQGKTDRLQVKAENPGNLKTTGYETSASTPIESGAVQSFAGPVEDTNRLTIKQRTDKAPS